MTWVDTSNNAQQISINSTNSTSSAASTESGGSGQSLAAQELDAGAENLEATDDSFAQHEAERDRHFSQLFNAAEHNAAGQNNGGYNPDEATTHAIHGIIAKNGGNAPGAVISVPSPALVHTLVKAGATETPEFGKLRNYFYANTRPGSAGLEPKTAFHLANQAYGAVKDKLVAQAANPVTRAQGSNPDVARDAASGQGASGTVQGPQGALVNNTTIGVPVVNQGTVVPGQQGAGPDQQGVGAGQLGNVTGLQGPGPVVPGQGMPTGTDGQGGGWNASNVPTSSAPLQLFSTGQVGQTTGLFGPHSSDSWLGAIGPNALVYIVMMLSMQEDNKDKGYFLHQINKFNTIGQQMNSYLSNVLEPAQAQLTKQQNACGNNVNDRQAQQVTVERQYNWDYELWQNKNTGSQETGYQVQSVKADSNELSALMKEFDQDQQTLNNKRDQVSNAFTAADQTSQQCFSMLTSFVKSCNDSSNAVIRNIAS